MKKKVNELREHLVALTLVLKEETKNHPDNPKLKSLLNACLEKHIPDFNTLTEQYDRVIEDLKEGKVQHDLGILFTEINLNYQKLKLGDTFSTQQFSNSKLSTTARFFNATIDPSLIQLFVRADTIAKNHLSTLTIDSNSTLHKIEPREHTPTLKP